MEEVTVWIFWIEGNYGLRISLQRWTLFHMMANEKDQNWNSDILPLLTIVHMVSSNTVCMKSEWGIPCKSLQWASKILKLCSEFLITATALIPMAIKQQLQLSRKFENTSVREFWRDMYGPLQYCAKVMQTIIDEYHALFSRFIADISAKHRMDYWTLKR